MTKQRTLPSLLLLTGLVASGCETGASSDELGAGSAALVLGKKSAASAALVKIDPSIIKPQPTSPHEEILRRTPPDFVFRPEPAPAKDPEPAKNPEPPKDPEPAKDPEPEDKGPTCSRTVIWLNPSTSGGCPTVLPMPTGTWTTRHVFGAGAPDALAQVCAFDWTPKPSTPNAPPNVTKLEAALGGPVELDCPVVSGFGGREPLPGELWKGMRDTARKQAGRPSAGLAKHAVTEVAIIDSAVGDVDDPEHVDFYGHGRLMGRLVEDLTCVDDESSCLTWVTNYLALPWQTIDVRDEEHGGVMGRREELAVAIHKAVNNYLDRLASDPDHAPPRLVLNLSLGWDPRHGGDSGTFFPAAGAVYRVLARASCLGIVSVAASGNAHGGSSDGAVLPAAWNETAAPFGDECKEYIGYNSDAIVDQLGLATDRDQKRPLVLAATALDERDHFLATTRSDARARFAAYGLSVVADERSPARGEHTDVMSGSSLAAAVTSAAIAGAWAVEPKWGPLDVAQLVHDSAVGLGVLGEAYRRAEMCFEHDESCEVRRVSVCNALAAASCEVGSCELSCDEVGAGEGEGAWDPALLYPEESTELTCAPAVPGARPGPSAAAEPWTHPQPSDPLGCNRCSFGLNSGKLILELNERVLRSTGTLFVDTDVGRFAVAPSRSGSYPTTITTTVPLRGSTTRVAVVRALNDGSRAEIAEDIIVIDD